MKVTIMLALSLFVFGVSQAQAQGPAVLSGDEKDACEAIICLSTGSPPHVCASPLDVFFSIVRKKPWKTVKARRDFLELCPDGDDDDLDGHKDDLVTFSMECSEKSIFDHLYTYDEESFGNQITSVATDVPEQCKNLLSSGYTDGGDFLPVRVMRWQHVVCDNEIDSCFGDYYIPVYRWFYVQDITQDWTVVYNPNSEQRFADAPCPVSSSAGLYAGSCRQVSQADDQSSDG